MRTKYKTLRGEERSKLRRKGSRFIGVGLHCESEESFSRRLEDLWGEFPDASHIAYAYSILDGERVLRRYDNDGEPAGTAGEPVLDIIKGRGLYNSALLVVRYFGGTELGTGGLIRAYGDSARAVLEKGSIVTVRRSRELWLEYPYRLTGPVMGLLDRKGMEVEELEYGERTRAKIRLPLDAVERVKRELIEATGGGIDFLDEEREGEG